MVYTGRPFDPPGVEFLHCSGAACRHYPLRVSDRPTERAPWALRSLYLAIGIWTAAIAPFSAVILKSRGVDTFTIGLLSGFAALAATVIVPSWGHLADVLMGRAFAFRVGVLISAFGAIALLLPLPLLVHAAILAGFSIFPVMFLAVGDALAVAALPRPERQYGALRALASLSFAVGVIAAGLVYDWTGYATVPLVSLLWSAVLFVLLGKAPDRTRDPAVRALAKGQEGDPTGGRFGSVSRALAVQPRLWAVLAVFTLTSIGLQGALLFVGIRIVELGGQPSDVALTFGIGAFAEIPGFVLAGWIGRRIGIRWLSTLSLVVSGLVIGSWGVLPAPIAINVTRIVTGFLFGAYSSSRVVIISRLLPVELQATGQTMAQGASAGLGNALGALIGGIVYAIFGPVVFFGLMGGLVAAGGIGSWIALYGSVGARMPATVDPPVVLPIP